MSQTDIFVGAFPTQRRAALHRPGCSDKYARAARSSPGSDAPQCPIVVSNEQGRAIGAFPTERRAALPRPGCSDKFARVARSSPGSDAPHCPRVVSNDQGVAVGNRRERGTCAGGMRERGGKEFSLRIGSWNVGSLTGKSAEVVEVMKRRRVNIMCLQETRWTGEGARGLVLGYKVWYVGQETSHMTRNGGARNGVGVILDERLSKEVIEVYRKNDRLIRVKLLCGKEIVNVISAYAPQIGLDVEEKRQFWEDLDEVVQGVHHSEKLYIGGDLNGHVGARRDGYESVHGGFGYGQKDPGGEAIMDFAQSYDLILANTWFKKRDSHLITFRSGANATQIDFLLTRSTDRQCCLNCKVIPGESVVTQHRLLVMTIRLEEKAKKKGRQEEPRIRWWTLRDAKAKVFTEKVIKEADWDGEVDPDMTWVRMKNCFLRVAKEVLGESRGRASIQRDTSWWNEEVKAVIKKKRECYQALGKCRSDETLTAYKEAKSKAKTTVRQAKEKTYQEVYEKLDSKEGEKIIYKMAKRRQEARKDIGMVKCVKDKNQMVLVQEEDIKDRWKGYFDELFNGSNGVVIGDTSVCDEEINMEYVRRIRRVEVEIALKKMKPKKAVGPDGVPIEVWRCLGKIGIDWLTDLFNKIWTATMIPQDWRKSTLVPVYKFKGDAQDCSNYRGIKLMSHTMKLWERVIEHRLRACTSISDNQFGFMPGRSTMEAIHLLRQMMEFYRVKKKNLHMVFIDLEKAYDMVPREVLWWAMLKKGIPRRYVDLVKDMYRNVSTNVRTCGGLTKDFPIKIGLHQGSALSPFLFATVLDEVTRPIQDEVPWCMLFADDIVLVDETKDGVNAKLEKWRQRLESRGFKLSRSKTEYLVCRFGTQRGTSDEVVSLDGKDLTMSECFKYLGSIIQKNGDIDQDVTHRIKSGWLKWRAATGVLCDRNIPLKLKGKFYRTAIRPVLLYGTECWASKKEHIKKIEVTEMRMLRWICGNTLRDRIRNEVIRKKVGVAGIADKLRENRLRWFGHVRRRPEGAPVRSLEEWDHGGDKRGRGRPKMTWLEGVRKDMKCMDVQEDEALDRKGWRRKIYVDDYME